jgi:hypothetical protein
VACDDTALENGVIFHDNQGTNVLKKLMKVDEIAKKKQQQALQSAVKTMAIRKKPKKDTKGTYQYHKVFYNFYNFII